MSDIARYHTSQEWTSKNPFLQNGEPGFEEDTGKLKIGDGVKHWNALPYVNVPAFTLPKPPMVIAGSTDISTPKAYPSSLPAGITLAHVYDPRNQTYNLTPSTLYNWRAAIARACVGGASARAHFIGDSTTKGTATANSELYSPTARLVRQTPTVAGQVPVVDAGFLLNDSQNDGRWTSLPSGWTFSGAAGYTNCLFGTSSVSGPAVFTVTGQDRLRVYFATNGGLGSCAITVTDSAGPHTQTANSDRGGGIDYIEFTGLVPGSQMVSLAVPSGGNGQFFPIAIETFSATGKVLILNEGQGGAGTDATVRGGVTGFQAESTLLHVGAATPDLWVYCMGINDWQASGVPATYQANIQSWITAFRGSKSDILLVVPNPPQNSNQTYNWNQYVQALYALADANNLPLLDLTARWVDHPTADGAGLKYNALHPSIAGNADIAFAHAALLFP